MNTTAQYESLQLVRVWDDFKRMEFVYTDPICAQTSHHLLKMLSTELYSD